MFQKIDEEGLVEQPLGYWERNSYLLAITDDDLDEAVDKFLDRITSIKSLRVIDSQKLSKEEPGQATIEYEGEEYYIGFYPTDFSLPEAYLSGNFYFSNEELHSLRNASKALTIFMKFNKDSYKSYHLHLKLIMASVNNLIGVMDESAERILPTKWVKMTAESNILPQSMDLYTVQAIYEDEGNLWLHTHGLCRCGLTELEILDSDKENYRNHYNLLSAFASYLLDKKTDFTPMQDYVKIGFLFNENPIIVTYLSWTKALAYFDNLELGNAQNRKEGHNSKTSVIFVYKTEEDAKNGNLSKVSDCNDLWGENLLFFISDEETEKMKKLAIERFDYVKECAKNEDNEIVVKIGLPSGNANSEPENIWFKLIEVDGDRFKARLDQDPLIVKDIKKGDEKWFTKENVVDWTIYTKEFSITPSTVYLLD